MVINVTYSNKSEKFYDHFIIEEFSNPEEIVELNISYNKLISIPESIGNLVNLRILYCHSNELISLPESIGNLVNLKNLDLSRNKLISLPESIGNLVALRYLNIYWNDLIELPQSIIKLRNLRYLNIDTNHITERPINIQRFIDRIQNKQSINFRVYNDGQNVHSSDVNNSVKSSITEILKEKSLYNFLEYI
jgi:Leucine-rich repeat (LRR) protein